MPPNISAQPKRVRFSGPVTVGKGTLELLSSGMYVEPLSIYREYVQNAADSLDEAKDLGLRLDSSVPSVAITVNPTERWVKIRDLGAGIRQSLFTKALTAIGESKKRGTIARGFRGVGRLAGLGYCQQLTMRAKYSDDTYVSCMYWDCRRLK